MILIKLNNHGIAKASFVPIVKVLILMVLYLVEEMVFPTSGINTIKSGITNNVLFTPSALQA
jgi:hypothetical protein